MSAIRRRMRPSRRSPTRRSTTAAGARRGRRSSGCVGRHRPPRAWRDPASRLRPAAGAPRRVRPADDPRDGQAARRSERRGHLRRRVPALVQRGSRAHRRTIRDEPGRHRAHDRVPASGRALLPDHAVELPARDGDPQDRPGARRRLHRRHQAGRADAAHHPLLREAPRRRGAPRWCAQRDHHVDIRCRLCADHRRPASAQAELHRVDRGRPQADRAVREERAAHVDGTRRQRAVHRLRRRRPRQGGRRCDAREVPQHR